MDGCILFSCTSLMKDNCFVFMSAGATCLPMILSVFSHYSLWHLGINMYVLWSFSGSIGSLLGKEQFLAMYLSAGELLNYQSLLNSLQDPWYIRLNPWLWIRGLRVRFMSMPGTFVLQQDTLCTLLLSTQVYKWVPGRIRTLFVAWCGMCVPLKWRLAWMLPGELRRCMMSAGLMLNNNTL